MDQQAIPGAQLLHVLDVLWDIQWSSCDHWDAHYLIRVVYLLSSGTIFHMFTARRVQKAPKLVCIMSLAATSFFFFLLWSWPKVKINKKKKWNIEGKQWMVKSNVSYFIMFYPELKSRCWPVSPNSDSSSQSVFCDIKQKFHKSVWRPDRTVGTEKQHRGAPVPVFVFTKTEPGMNRSLPSR